MPEILTEFAFIFTVFLVVIMIINYYLHQKIVSIIVELESFGTILKDELANVKKDIHNLKQ